MSVVLTGVFFLSGCAAKPKEPEGPHDVPLTITADFSKSGDGSNWETIDQRSDEYFSERYQHNYTIRVSLSPVLTTEATLSLRRPRYLPRTHS